MHTYYYIGNLTEEQAIEKLRLAGFNPPIRDIAFYVNRALNVYQKEACVSITDNSYGPKGHYDEHHFDQVFFEHTHLVVTTKFAVIFKGSVKEGQRCSIIYTGCNLPSGSHAVYNHNKYIIETPTGQAFVDDSNIQPLRPKIMVGQHEVIISKDGIKVGCTSINAETVRKIISEWYCQTGITLKI